MKKIEEYEELLQRAMEKMPKKGDSKKRFQIPQAIVEISGSKTTIKNFSEILQTLRRDSGHLAKYLSREVATGGSVQENVLIFQGKVFREIIEKKLQDYVKEFIYCKQCGEPDTKLVKDAKIVLMVCEACGAKHPVRSI